MATAEDYECFFRKLKSEIILLTTVKEKRMNKYIINAREIRTARFEVEAVSEQEAINDVEWGNVDADDYEFEELVDVEVIDVEYGEQMYTADLTLSFNAKGCNEDDVRDMLWDLLASFDGQTAEQGEGVIEAIGFNIVDMQEA